MGTLWQNGTFFTLAEQDATVEAVYVVDGRIAAMGSKEQLLEQFKESITEIKDVAGGFVYPGFVDSHLHMIGHGEKLLRLDLSQATSSHEMESWLIKKHRKIKKKNGSLRKVGMNIIFQTKKYLQDTN